MKDSTLKKGIAIMLSSALLTSVGQLCWKISSTQYFYLFLLSGFVLYGIGALLMIIALRFGNLSVLHPMLSAGYGLSVLLGYFVLHEPIAITKLAGITVIVIGLFCLSIPEEARKK